MISALLLTVTLAALPVPDVPTWCSSLAQVAATAEQARAAGATLDQVLAGLQTLPHDARPAAAGTMGHLHHRADAA